MIRSDDPIRWSGPMILSDFSDPMIRSDDPVQWSDPMMRSNDPIQWSNPTFVDASLCKQLYLPWNWARCVSFLISISISTWRDKLYSWRMYGYL